MPVAPKFVRTIFHANLQRFIHKAAIFRPWYLVPLPATDCTNSLLRYRRDRPQESVKVMDERPQELWQLAHGAEAGDGVYETNLSPIRMAHIERLFAHSKPSASQQHASSKHRRVACLLPAATTTPAGVFVCVDVCVCACVGTYLLMCVCVHV